MSTLHPTKTVQSVQPKYVSSFTCTGSACEDTCCAGWNVFVDKKTFTAYKQSKVPELTERLDAAVKRARSLNSDTHYARIEMLPVNQECPLLEEKLCSVQRTLGEDKLSNTCATYPRNHRVTGGQHEQSLTLSCPEAARLALLQADAMDFSEENIRLRSEVAISTIPKQGLSFELSNNIRLFSLKLMRTADLELWQKLAVLGVFCENLTLKLKNGEHSMIDNLIEDSTRLVVNGEVFDALSIMKPDYVMQATIFSGLWRVKLARKHSIVQEALHKEIIKGLGADELTHEITINQIISSYTQGVKNLPDAMKDVPFILENYVLNDMFSEVFPFGEKTPHEHYLKLVTRLGLVRFMLAAQCREQEKLPTSEQMARTIQVFCRQYQHDSKYARTVNTALANAGWTSMDKIFRFLRT